MSNLVFEEQPKMEVLTVNPADFVEEDYECDSTSAGWVCTHCPQIFATSQQLHAHRSSHRPGKKKPPNLFLCSDCGKQFPIRQRLNEHLLTHTKERPFQCSHCPARFAQRSNWRTHIHNTHLKQANFHCPVCPDKHFNRRRLLDQHVKTVHEQRRDIQCELCNATFSHPVNYKKHLLSHSGTKPFKCEICGKLFGRAENRDIHRFVHSNSKPYVCAVCGEGFMRKQQLLQHSTASQHPNEKIVRQKPQFSPQLAQHRKDNAKKD